MVHYESFLWKQGHIRRNWKRRFFQLDGTQIRYFSDAQTDSATDKQGIGEKGTITLTGWRIQADRSRSLLLQGKPKNLLIQADDEATLEGWKAALTAALDATMRLPNDAPSSTGSSKELLADQRMVSLGDFKVKSVLGRGAFATVALVMKKDTKQQYALKSLNKRHVIARHQVQATLTEREILRDACGHPFIVGLHWAFRSEDCLHFVLDYMPGGDLQGRLLVEGEVPADRARLYVAEITLAVGFLHEKGVIYRDLKPDNVLLDSEGHARLADFGLSKVSDTASSFCGTQDYMSPEVVKSLPHDKAVDWWAVGILLHELLLGYTPFSHDNFAIVQRNIIKKDIEIDDECDAVAAAFIVRLLQKDAAARLGAGPTGTSDVQGDPFFAGLDFERVLARGYTTGWKPPKKGVGSYRNSEGQEVPAIPKDGSMEDSMDDVLSDEAASPADDFGGFSYRREAM
mmetsp:Transcript_45722/g.75666  ORF Transcript_45722/g.75666 Transcript_45722/m.75666 type:complete len:458 (+) Transcript_45722:169-1542(+)|eukprot:CAMPEP_0119332316 /NCGR_PEP_ID=MMETSP1333-20130426/82461_1 /TAXON_ID=418940 /ORGANISM="Scyphosphaera apsteinii, Strain RCC1455" /LENGTH=457 /DNA_ID=CAMNT_0007342113 /DNA_START=159 /DNA_END=1532 /DNA_ORIENTATION=+